MQNYFNHLFTVIAFVFFGAQSWAIDHAIWGCGNSEGVAFRDAESKIHALLVRAKHQCESQGGAFSSATRRGFCTPFNPNDLICNIECPVFASSSCHSEPMFVQETISFSEKQGNQDGVFDPGETIGIEVSVNNPSSKNIKELFVRVSQESQETFLDIEQNAVFLDNLSVSKTKNAAFSAKIRPNTKCGSKTLLKFVLTGTHFRYRFSSPLAVGKAAAPITVNASNLSLPLTQTGVSYPISVNAPNIDAYQVKLRYTAKVDQPGRYRAWLTSPNQIPAWAYFNNETQKDLLFNVDLTQYLNGAKTGGQWHLSGDYSGTGAATITSYQLSVTPDKFTCR